MLCLRLSVPCRNDLSQTHRKARVRHRSLGFDLPDRAHLLGTSLHSLLRIRSRKLLLVRAPWCQKFVRPVSDGSMGGNGWVFGPSFSTTIDGHPPDVRPIFLS